MEIKGVAVKTIPLFVKTKYANRYEEWLNSLSDSSKKIIANTILDSALYDIEDAAIFPTKSICKLFFNNNDKGAWELGRFSVDVGIKGIYKIFFNIFSINTLISKGSRIMSSYYNGCETEVKKLGNGSAYMRIIKFGKPNHLIELRIGGWIERAMELCGGKNIKIEIVKSLTRGDNVTEYQFNWS